MSEFSPPYPRQYTHMTSSGYIICLMHYKFQSTPKGDLPRIMFFILNPFWINKNVFPLAIYQVPCVSTNVPFGPLFNVIFPTFIVERLQ